MTDSRKPMPPARIVPVHRGKATTTTEPDTCQRAWMESDRPDRVPPESEREPFLVAAGGSDGSETSSLECERLCTAQVFPKRARIFSIDLERGGGGHGKTSGQVTPTGSVGSGDCTSNDDSHSDAKLWAGGPANRKANRRKRKRPASRLLQLCQCCPWTVPWSLLIVSALQK
uniref:Rhomboid-like protein n=1 Tax=Anopheles quadriannulatus TaxID=34691 RepID=A0A182XIP9_ANOQN